MGVLKPNIHGVVDLTVVRGQDFRVRITLKVRLSLHDRRVRYIAMNNNKKKKIVHVSVLGRAR